MRRINNIRLGVKKSMARRIAYASLFILASGCTANRFLKTGETYYGGARIDINTRGHRIPGKQDLEKELQTFITPEPNGKLLGMRPGVWFFNIAGEPKKKKGIRGFIKNKLGQRPVLLQDATPEKTSKVLSSHLNNEGYFASTVTANVKAGKKESKIIYEVNLTRPYTLREIHYPRPRDSTYAAIVRTLETESLLKPEQRFDLQRIQAEQQRIEEVLQNNGFYYFDDRYLIFEADTTVGNRSVDLELKLEPGIPKRGRKIYYLNELNIFPDYRLSMDTTRLAYDTTKVNNYNYFDTHGTFRPEIITRVINLEKGKRYARSSQELTLSHLMGLGTFKFVNIKFTEPFPDSTLLNANIFLTPLKKKSLRLEVQAVSKSNNFVGPGLGLVFTNRNFFRGAELFQWKLNAAYEWQINRQNRGPLNSFETGLEASLTIPRFISPIRIDYNGRRYLPKTKIIAGFDFQNRISYYRLNSLSLSYGYIWRETAAKSHELFPIDINFVKTDKKSSAFEDILMNNPALTSSFENQFIVGSRYAYTLNTLLNEQKDSRFNSLGYKKHHFYFNGNVDVAGNMMHLVQSAFQSSQESPYQLFGSPYSQFVRADIDFRHYWKMDRHNQVVTRVVIGAGSAFGNSVTLPYIKQFSVGGSNSIRAFPARSVGPGTYDIRSTIPKDSTIFIDQRGDIKLEGNLEYRFDIIKSLKGALFVDAGNIWLLKFDPNRPGGEFGWNTFANQIAVGTGIGLRFDFSFFVLRLDTAFPLRKPYLDKPWVLDEIDFGSKNWRRDNLVFNIAIGYPF